jgi:hypothetical protein
MYTEILGREGDVGGVEAWNAAMNGGMTEAQVREAFLRSDEYALRFPGAVQPPIPPPPTDGGMALKVEGNKFLNAAGQVVRLQGVIACCADADVDSPGTLEYGWPLVNVPFLELLAQYKQNFCHIRLGPMLQKNWDGQGADGETNPGVQGYVLRANKYDLDQFEPTYWTGVEQVIVAARALGIYVQVDLADAWVLDHQLGPWSDERNHQNWEGGSLAVMSAAPKGYHEKWIRQAVKVCGRFDNVLWQDGNESFKGGNGMAPWVLGMRNIVRDEENRDSYAHRPFGTNSQREEIEEGCDYGVYHEKTAPDPTTHPRMTNEYGDLSPSGVLAQVRIAWASEGVQFHYWRGGHNGKDFLATLETIKRIVTGEDVPPDIPDHCPPLVKTGSKIHNIMDGGFQMVDKPVRGGYVVVDSTPRFGSGRGEPCNEEHPGCGGRPCEDPRGQLWRLEEGDAPLHLQTNNFQCRVGPLKAGHYTLRCLPRLDYTDALGKPVVVTDAAKEGTTTEWSVA